MFLVFMTQCNSIKNIQNDTSEAVSSTHKTAIIVIEGMACQEGCADTIKANLKNIKGVQYAEVSYNKKQAVISYNKGTVTLDDLKNTITNTKVKEYTYTIKNVLLQNQKSK